MFRRTFDKSIFFSMLAILIGGMVPAVLVLMNQLDSNLLPGMLSGVAVYFIFLRRKNTESNDE